MDFIMGQAVGIADLVAAPGGPEMHLSMCSRGCAKVTSVRRRQRRLQQSVGPLEQD